MTKPEQTKTLRDKLIERRKIREEGEIADPTMDASLQQPAAQVPPAAPVPSSPLTPPQPGMIPTGWMFPNQSPQAQVMQTGDVNMASQPAIGAGMVGEQPITNEEAQMVQEYRKWSKTRKLEALKGRLAKRMESADEADYKAPKPADKKMTGPVKDENAVTEKAKRSAKALKEEEYEDEVPVQMPDNINLETPPVEGDIQDEENAEGFEADLSDEEIVDELGDIALDINKLFLDAGGDEEVLEGETEEGEEFEGEEAPEEETAEPEEEPSMEEKKAARAKKVREAALRANAVAIKFPAGTPAPQPSADVVARAYGTEENMVESMKKRSVERKAALKELRRTAVKLNEDDTPPVSEQPEVEEMMIDEIAAIGADPDTITEAAKEKIRKALRARKAARSSIIKESAEGSRPAQFMKRFEEKKALDFKKMLNDGFLG